MPKAPLHPVLSQIQHSLIEAMQEGLKDWRPDLNYPESMSDYESLARGIMERFVVKPQDSYLIYDDDIEEWIKERNYMPRYRDIRSAYPID